MNRISVYFWFERHLKWTYILTGSIGVLLFVGDSIIGGIYSVLVGLPVSAWVLTQKGRSLWWIFLNGLAAPLWLPSKNSKPE
jgi:hypothetical protein